MQLDDVFEFQTGTVLVVGRLEGTDRPVVDVPGVLELESGETYDVTIVSSRMPGPRSAPCSTALTLGGVPTKVVSSIRSGTRAVLTFDVAGQRSA